MNLSPSDLDAIAEKVAFKLTRQKAPVLSLDEAMALVGCGSPQSLYRWCHRWGVRSSGKGRYSRSALMNALRREEERGQRKTDAPKLCA
jgi:hypothetical protein